MPFRPSGLLLAEQEPEGRKVFQFRHKLPHNALCTTRRSAGARRSLRFMNNHYPFKMNVPLYLS